ncbi:MFS general substrate transporter [Desarmillaria tabescens]|uniref:MFS general substrate transporter n=1 Tax=Armillaria tabescens TaxID=1929756 RepID=A0AA39KBV1_ARMTA|nr:MFS general substrate transporter [Desarmillaria tabescens]KAK0457110.1 MFS general substrate transporter [Desarmillaria tabescens]
MQPPSTSSPIDNPPSSLHGEPQIRPWGWRWRSSYWFVTFVVWLGVATDLLVYSMVIPVVPFQLEDLGYKDVASLTGWLLFAYSGGLAIATIPVAVWSEKYDARKVPLVAGVFILIGSQIMFMEAPAYWLMCLARALQGIGSTMVWVVGLALLCDEAPPELVGRQLGIAMSGLSLGYVARDLHFALVGPPVGGGLYTWFGFRGPFIFGIIVAFLDLAFRFLLIEGKSASKPRSSATEKPDNEIALEANDNNLTDIGDVAGAQNKVSFVQVLRLLFRSHRALAAAFLTFVYGIVYSSQEPVISTHLNSVWGLNSSKVGLVLLASVIPTLFASPLSGWFSDHQGASVVIIVALILAVPWYVVMIIDGHLALFITAFACAYFFAAGVLSPLTVELASVARSIDGIGYAHVYGAFNLAYGIGTTVGPVVGGQMYDHIHKGWLAICLLATGLLGLSVVVAFFYVGDKPIAQSFIRHIRLL